ncbi:MAG: ACP S-malonyltransferase [Chloroflexi bacterium]|nr:ACP S-malonyltransferase [Chloroflexota bacterium]
MSRLAFIFPGQGSQHVGMGQDAYEAYPAVRSMFDEADALLGFPLSALCFAGPEEVLDDTINTQPAVFVTSVALWRAIEPQLSGVAFFAGHSLGEYSALVAAGALDFAAGLRLVRERGRLMKAAGEQGRGGMAAVLGLDAPTLEGICERAREATGGVVQAANYNAPGQIVISGDEVALTEAMERAKAAGARKVVRLAVSIAAHSPLMAPAVASFRQAVEATVFRAPRVPVVGNVTARPLAAVGEIAEELVQQLTAPVRWTESVQWMIGQGVDTFVEVGPGQVLTGLMKRIDRSVRRVTVGNVADIRAFLEA